MAVGKLAEKLNDIETNLPDCSQLPDCPVSLWLKRGKSAGGGRSLCREFPAQEATLCFSHPERPYSAAISCYNALTPALDRSGAGHIDLELSISSRAERTRAMKGRGTKSGKKGPKKRSPPGL